MCVVECDLLLNVCSSSQSSAVAASPKAKSPVQTVAFVCLCLFVDKTEQTEPAMGRSRLANFVRRARTAGVDRGHPKNEQPRYDEPERSSYLLLVGWCVRFVDSLHVRCALFSDIYNRAKQKLEDKYTVEQIYKKVDNFHTRLKASI